MPYVSTDSARFAVVVFGSMNHRKWFYSEPFAIRPDARWPDAPPQITLLAPGAGQEYIAGSTIPLAWTASDNDPLRSFDILASLDNGLTWQTVAKDLPPTARDYSWRLPANGGAVSPARVRVVAVDRRFQNSSDGQNTIFKILPASVDTPRLRIFRTGNNITIAWPATATGFNLKSTDHLSPNAVWYDVITTPTSVRDEKAVTLPLAQGSRFFHLEKP